MSTTGISLEDLIIFLPIGDNGSLEEPPAPTVPTDDGPPDIDESPYAMVIKTLDQTYFFGAPIAPREVSYTGWGLNWTEVARDGRGPYLVNESTKLPKISFQLIIGNSKSTNWDATETLKTLRSLSMTRKPIQLTYGGFFESNYLWRMTSLDFSSVYRHPETNAITQATADVEMTVLSDVVLTLGPVSNKPKPLPKKPTGKNVGKRKYTVKKGDTLHKLAHKFYKNVAYWRYLADLNKIKHLPKPGKKIKY